MARSYSDDITAFIVKLDREIKEAEQSGLAGGEHVADLQNRRAQYMEKLRTVMMAEMEDDEEAADYGNA